MLWNLSISTISGNEVVMNIGRKLTILKDSLGIKNWSDYGKRIGLPGDWLLEQSKKEDVTTIDITRLIKIAKFHGIKVDDLLDQTNEILIEKQSDLPSNDIYQMIDNIINQAQKDDVSFNGFPVNEESKAVICDTMEIIKGFIQQYL
jgi:hypothetical protein